jgi:cysteine desulfurase
MLPIYLDNNATTQVAPEVAKVFFEELIQVPSNPSSIHTYGRKAKSRLIRSCDDILSHFNRNDLNIIFTSSGTEAANTIIKGVAKTFKSSHIISSNLEHAAVYKTLLCLEKEGHEVSYLPCDQNGVISADSVIANIRPNTKIITLMAANNETGVKLDIESIAKISKEKNIIFIIDAVSWIGKEPFNFHDGISAIFFSGHKFHAPKGIGAIIHKKNLKFETLLLGGNQQRGKRAGTENLPAILALAKAFELFDDKHCAYMKTLRVYFEENILKNIPNTLINGSSNRLCNTSNLSFLDQEGEVMLMKLDLESVMASHGSACSSGALEPSRVLLNMQLGKDRALSAIRFSLSRFTTKEEIDRAIEIIKKVHSSSNK